MHVQTGFTSSTAGHFYRAMHRTSSLPKQLAVVLNLFRKSFFRFLKNSEPALCKGKDRKAIIYTHKFWVHRRKETFFYGWRKIKLMILSGKELCFINTCISTYKILSYASYSRLGQHWYAMTFLNNWSITLLTLTRTRIRTTMCFTSVLSKEYIESPFYHKEVNSLFFLKLLF